MKISFSETIFTAIILFAMAFTFSACSSADGGNQSDGSSIEYGGQKYRTVKIGTQTWMAENLNYATEGSKCYDNDPANCNKYGRLYDWATAMSICPEGWRLPNNDDWDALYLYVDPSYDKNAQDGYRYSAIAGKYLKAKRGWDSYDGIANEDTYGFAALPGGSVSGCLLFGGGYSDECFRNLGSHGIWWSASDDDDYAWYRYMSYDSNYADLDVGSKIGYFISVRCLQ